MSKQIDAGTRRRAGSTLMPVLVTLMVALLVAAAWSALAAEGEVALDLSAASAAVAVLVALVAVVRRPPVLDVRVVEGELRVRFSGWDVVWTLRREIRIPVEHIRSVRVYRADDLWSGWWHRRLGTVIPGTIKAGWFRGGEQRELWDVRAGADVIDVALAPPSPMSRLVLQTPDPDAVAQSLTTAARNPRCAQTTTTGARVIETPGVPDRVQVHLEELGQHSWYKALLNTLTGTNGSAQFRFVARRAGEPDAPDRHVREGGTFPVMRGQDLGDEHQPNAWSDLAHQRLEELDDSLSHDGWHRSKEMGRHWWSRTYEATR